MKILVVDDEPDFLELIKIFLERSSDEMEVDCVTSAEEALRQLGDECYEAVVSDYMMPDIDGLNLLKILKRERDLDIPFIMFTGKGGEEVAMDALNLGADGYFRKDGSPDMQYSILADAIEREVEELRA